MYRIILSLAFLANAYSSEPINDVSKSTDSLNVTVDENSINYGFETDSGIVNVPPQVIIAFSQSLIKKGYKASGLTKTAYEQMVQDITTLKTITDFNHLSDLNTKIVHRLFNNCMVATNKDISRLIGKLPAGDIEKQALTAALTATAQQLTTQPIPKTAAGCFSCFGNIATTVATQLLLAQVSANQPN